MDYELWTCVWRVTLWPYCFVYIRRGPGILWACLDEFVGLNVDTITDRHTLHDESSLLLYQSRSPATQLWAMARSNDSMMHQQHTRLVMFVGLVVEELRVGKSACVSVREAVAKKLNQDWTMSL